MKKLNNKDVSELDSARANFANLLKKWNRKTNIHNYEDRNQNYNSTSFASHTDYEDYDATSPVQKYKRIKVSRKTKKRLSEDEFVQPSSCMLKLFDRSVDLAQFSENTPLYALCRAWVKNPPTNEIKDELDDENQDDDTQAEQMNVDEEFIYELPAPDKSRRDLRIPKSVKKPTTSTKDIDKAINSLKNEKLEKILEMNKKRWKEVRAEWRKASLENEKRYRKSFLILKEMYDKSIAAQSVTEPIVS